MMTNCKRLEVHGVYERFMNLFPHRIRVQFASLGTAIQISLELAIAQLDEVSYG